MEYMNCEQYVLGELEEATAAIDKLTQENDRLQAQVEILEGQVNAPKGSIREAIEKKGREAVFSDWFRRYITVGDMPFESWAIESSENYSLPKNLRSEAIAFFEPELREAYEDKRLEEQEAAE